MGLLASGAELHRLALTQAAEPVRSSGRTLVYGNSNARFAAPVQLKRSADLKLRLDLRRRHGRIVGMAEISDVDEETRVLVEQLCTRAGMLMEDVSVQALTRAASLEDLLLKVEHSRFAVGHMDRLLGAAEALLRLSWASEAPGSSRSRM